ncbi:MAG: hypothetical protein A2V79_09665 [Betaproteobacteria bacterium RBG_16_56_24]|nr:MAG: hypothetical protein A2V79_09665 [Betaproteobacteria bacterium RBG_16_56_24]
MNKSKKQKLRNTHPGEATLEGRDTSHRLGFMQGEITAPADFDRMGKDEIAHLFKAVPIATRGYRFNRDAANER